eukprot:TRINITY_DN18804_c0_g1_i1.p1 TRINITY_DN18804_c0_g1~~TRINITY_DN18804_c0_g1_i1.p1  ORF type:complete len:619 (-),score=115.73 TRINITY_DN18804_c0_g1_i1:69-1925(-)
MTALSLSFGMSRALPDPAACGLSFGRDTYVKASMGGPLPPGPKGQTALPPMRSLTQHQQSEPYRAAGCISRVQVATTDALGNETGRGCDHLEARMFDSALATLATRVGGLRGLPELHVLIHDTVSATIRNIKSIVESQVCSVLEKEKISVVQDMVQRLLTEEALRTMDESAKALSKRQLAIVESNQVRAREALNACEMALRSDIEKLRNGHVVAAEDASKISEGISALGCRLQSLEADTAQRLARVEKGLISHEDAIGGVRASLRADQDRSDALKEQVEALKILCDERYVEKAHLQATAASLEGEFRQNQADAAVLFEERLRSHALQSQVEQLLDDFRAELRGELRLARNELAADCEQTRRVSAQTFRDVCERCPSKADFKEYGQRVEEDRRALGENISADIARLRDNVAMQDMVKKEIDTLHSERSVMESHFHHACADIGEKAQTSENTLQTAQLQIEGLNKQSTTSFNQLLDVRHQVALLASDLAIMKEKFAEHTVRTKQVAAQQSGHRSDVSVVLARLDDVGDITSEVQAMKSVHADQARDISKLQAEVFQWSDAITAQQDLRREASSLRTSLSEVCAKFAQYDKEQQLCHAQLRDLHRQWLGHGTDRGIKESFE